MYILEKIDHTEKRMKITKDFPENKRTERKHHEDYKEKKESQSIVVLGFVSYYAQCIILILGNGGC